MITWKLERRPILVQLFIDNSNIKKICKKNKKYSLIVFFLLLTTLIIQNFITKTHKQTV